MKIIVRIVVGLYDRNLELAGKVEEIIDDIIKVLIVDAC